MFNDNNSDSAHGWWVWRRISQPHHESNGSSCLLRGPAEYLTPYRITLTRNAVSGSQQSLSVCVSVSVSFSEYFTGSHHSSPSIPYEHHSQSPERKAYDGGVLRGVVPNLVRTVKSCNSKRKKRCGNARADGNRDGIGILLFTLNFP